jgi:hypothetical protein
MSSVEPWKTPVGPVGAMLAGPLSSAPSNLCRGHSTITLLTPERIERIRATLIDQGRVRDATPVCGRKRPWRCAGGTSERTRC